MDDAGVLSEQHRAPSIEDHQRTARDASCNGAQIGVLTVDYTGSATTEDYAAAAANAWGIGSSSARTTACSSCW